MTKEQFKNKFKVGDIITCSEWGECKTKIVHIGKYEFAGDDQGLNSFEDGVDSHFMDARDWQLWEESVEKDLEEYQKYYRIYKEKEKVENIQVRYEKKRFKEEGEDYTIEYLTEEEAIERGLKI